MRLIVLLVIAPLLVRAQYPNRPAAHAPGEFSRGLPVQAHSAARPPVGPAPLGSRSLGPGFLNGTGFIGNNGGGSRSHSSGRRDRQSLPLGYFAAPYYYPFGDYGTSSFNPYPYDPADDPNASAGADVTANLLGEQIQRLSAQVEQLKSEQQPAPPANASQAAPQEAPPVAPITVVLRDGQRLQVASYAVMGRVFWDFSKQPGRRIPVADIDVAASTKATEAAGGEFPELAAGR
jgi:hypothetical protein